MAKLKYITLEQYEELGTMGRELYRYWTKFRPKFSKELAEDGTFWEYLKDEGDRYDRILDELMEGGMEEYRAAEIPRAMYLETPPEPGT